MGIINRHYFCQLCVTTFISTTILLGILLYGNLVKHDEYLLQAMAVSPYTFIQLSSLLVPYALSFALPFGFILALLFCYGKWASSNQILALRSLGKGIFSWGLPPLFLSLLVSIFSVFTILDWGPTSRAQFDYQKSTILWANINSHLEKEGEVEFDLVKDNTILTNRNLNALSGQSISKVSLSVGSTDQNNWYNLRILLFDENHKMVRIINSRSAHVSKSDDNTKLLLDLKNVDLQSSEQNQTQNAFISFEQWDEPLIFEINNRNDELNINRVGLELLMKLANSKSTESDEAKVLIYKGFALGTSSFFLSLLLVPISIKSGRKESITNLSLGIILSVLYYTTLIFLEEVSVLYSQPIFTWFPNLLCIIIGSYLFYEFESSI
ncbi:MAG: YjgP/YjgQ family permease [Opitutae bacterium]|jgi:lipopolysaccharide export LptBFGC system permease protein LptF|nr:YjgP/YjgQ family permease [Opitutae bacterium]MBT5717197.1 YjgP/YjgQ family permease [Opitutae bacterium]